MFEVIYSIDVYYDKIRLHLPGSYCDIPRESKTYEQIKKKMHESFSFCKTSEEVCSYICWCFKEGEIE